MSINVHYWRTYELSDPDLRRAQAELENPSSRTAQLAALELLLRSDSLQANCIALDHYKAAETEERHGRSNIFRGLDELVRTKARSVINRRCEELELIAGDCVNAYLSALSAMVNLASSTDAGAIASILGTSVDRDVRLTAAALAGRALKESRSDALERALADIVGDETRPFMEREAALDSLSQSPIGVVVALGALRSSDVRLQIAAAYVLALGDLEPHRSRLEGVVASWPDDAPYPASEVRELLTGPERDDAVANDDDSDGASDP